MRILEQFLSCNLFSINSLSITLHRDPDYFRPTTRFSAQDSANWVLHFSSLKRLYRLMTQYFSDVLQKPTSGLDVPDLQAMARNADDTATLVMCRLTIAIGVQCEKNKEFIDKIQGLSQVDQHYLMKVIEQVRRSQSRSECRLTGTQVMSRISTSNSSDIGEASMTEYIVILTGIHTISE